MCIRDSVERKKRRRKVTQCNGRTKTQERPMNENRNNFWSEFLWQRNLFHEKKLDVYLIETTYTHHHIHNTINWWELLNLLELLLSQTLNLIKSVQLTLYLCNNFVLWILRVRDTQREEDGLIVFPFWKALIFSDKIILNRLYNYKDWRTPSHRYANEKKK